MESSGKSRTKSLGDVLTATTSMIDKIPPPIHPSDQPDPELSIDDAEATPLPSHDPHEASAPDADSNPTASPSISRSPSTPSNSRSPDPFSVASTSPKQISFGSHLKKSVDLAEGEGVSAAADGDSKVSPIGWKATAPSEKGRVMRRSNSGTRHHVVTRPESQNPANTNYFFDKNFMTNSASSMSASHGAFIKERDTKGKSPTAARNASAADTQGQKSKMKRQLSGRRDKQKLIEEEIMRWSGGGSGGGGGEGDSDKQAEIARQVALWAADDKDRKKGPKAAKVVRVGSDQHAASSAQAASAGKKEKKAEPPGDTVALIYRTPSVGSGKYGLALWKTNAKVRTVTARLILKTPEGEVILSRVMDLGRSDLVSKTTFVVTPAESPASIELIVSHTRCAADSPISVTLQLLQPGGAAPVDVPLPLEHHERERMTILETKRASTVKLWRSLLINVVGARDIPPNLTNIYVTVHIGANYDRTTTLWSCTKEPIWRAHFDFELRQSPDRYFMVFTLWEASDKSGRDSAVSQIRLPLCNLLTQELLSDWFPLDSVEFDSVSGRLHVQTIFEQESLLVKVLEGVGVWEEKRGGGERVAKEKETERLFVMVQLGKSVRRTRLVDAAANPLFGEEFLFSTSEEMLAHEFLFISVWNADETRFFGQIKIPLFDIKPDRLNDQMYPLCSRFDSRARGGGGKKGAKHGELKLEMQYTQSTILNLDFYRELMDLLVDGDGQLLVLLGKIIPSAGWEKLARIVANILHFTGSATRVLSRYAIQEIENTPDPRVLFRGNTLVTKLIDAYQKIVGLNYLKSVIQPTIKRVYELRKAIDLDPSRVDKETLLRNRMMFENEFTSITEAIFSSASECPEPMRVIYSNLERKIIEKYSPNEGDIVRHTVVNSFLVLRLFVPAFLTPTVFQLMPDFPAEHTSRSLTLLGKSLQNLANFTHFGEKDPNMACVNDAILECVDGMKIFYSQVSTPPKEWNEAASADAAGRGGGGLERELSLLLELVRAKHAEIRSKGEVNPEFFSKLMSACHVVVKAEEGRAEVDRGEKGGGGSTPNEIAGQSSSSPSPLPSPMQSPSFFAVDHLDSNTEKPAEDIPFPYTISDENDVEMEHASGSSTFGVELGDVCESAQRNLEEFEMCFGRMKEAAANWDFFEAVKCRDAMLRAYGELIVSLKLLKKLVAAEEEEEKRVGVLCGEIEALQGRVAENVSAYLACRAGEEEKGVL